MNPRFPLYIPSKGRWESRLTVKALDRMGVPFKIIVEEQEHEAYCSVIPKERVLILDPEYQRKYDPGDDLGFEKSKGSGPARNFAWDHAASEGHDFHWIMDDNIRSFLVINRNKFAYAGTGTFFRYMEDFVLRYENISMAGPNYFMFVPRKQKIPPFVINTRIYSCNLIRCDTPFRWRCRYNEDTDLSLRMLKAGWSTVLFNFFMQEKMTTQSMKGGNTDEVYKNGTLDKSQMMVALHPDVARLAWRFGRWHHYVDYTPFKHQGLKRKPRSEWPTDSGPYAVKTHELEDSFMKKGPRDG